MKQPRGIRNNNPLNIRKGADWLGQAASQDDPSFIQFESMQFGIRAAFKLMRNHVSGFGGSRPPRNTISKLISVWAPPSENATTKYIDFVCQAVGLQASEIIDPNDSTLMIKIARAMAFVECGQWINEDIFKSAWFLI